VQPPSAFSRAWLDSPLRPFRLFVLFLLFALRALKQLKPKREITFCLKRLCPSHIFHNARTDDLRRWKTLPIVPHAEGGSNRIALQPPTRS
jgi:hypothetical protein